MNTAPASSEFRALIVDDEGSVRNLLVLALKREQVACDEAKNGAEALRCLNANRYDLVITDLRMPVLHGHALAAELLQHDDRPVLIVLTGVAEPRLAKDLLSRGVDDIVFKPTNFTILAAKALNLVRRKRERQSVDAAAELGGDLEPVDAEQLDRRLRDAHTLLPISPVAMEIVALSEAGGTPKAYSELVRCDATLTAGVLRAANSVFFNPGGKPVVEIEEAVLRLGDKRLMEIALGSAVLQSITSQSTPGFDVRLAWRRGLAAAVATELISEQADEGSLFLCALVHNLGRLILARLFPQHYAAMIETAAAKGCSLEEQERRCFANSPLAALAGVVQAWNLPIEVTAPLRLWAGDDELSNDWTPRLRRQVKTLRLASEVGVYAVGQWEPWERISLQDSAFGETSHKVAARWISETQRRLADSLSGADSRRRTPRSTATDSQRMEIVYERRRTHSADPLELLLESLGFSLVEAPPRPRPVVVNQFGAWAAPAEVIRRHRSTAATLVVSDAPRPVGLETAWTQLPCTFSALSGELAALCEATPGARSPETPALA